MKIIYDRNVHPVCFKPVKCISKQLQYMLYILFAGQPQVNWSIHGEAIENSVVEPLLIHYGQRPVSVGCIILYCS